MSSSAVKKSTELKSPEAVGTHHRLVCMTGNSKGNVYYLTGKRIIIGRSDKADIQIVDTKISREHAEITYSGDGYIITDLGTANGIIVNDKKVAQTFLYDGEKVVIGQTVLKYNIIVVSEKNNMITTVKGDKKTTKIKAKIAAVPNDDFSLHDLEPMKTEEKKKPQLLLVTIIIAVVMYLLFDNRDTKKKEARKSSISPEDSFNVNPEGTMSKKMTVDETENKKRFLSILHEGQREARESNYFRAIEDFNRALQLIPNNGQASYYLSKAKQQLDDEIEKNFTKGNNEYDSKKYKGAISSYCAIEQLLQDYPNDKRYLNAVAKITAIEAELDKEKGEIKCFEEKQAD